MKVFVSWSGQRSKAVAELISDWIKCVLQASHPWISTRDIDKGAIWFSEISDQLKDTAAGIVCLTQENKNKPWILFETGALAKGLSTNRVCTFLIDLQPSDIEDPLAQFNHTMPERTSMWGLTCSLNNCLDSQRLDERILKQVFETYWPQFEAGFKKALADNKPTEVVEPRSEESILSEILRNTRSLTTRIREIEMKVEDGRIFGASNTASSIALNMPTDDFISEFINQREESGFSPAKIRAELETMGYPRSLLNEIFAKRGVFFTVSTDHIRPTKKKE